MFELIFTHEAQRQLDELDASERHKPLTRQVKKALGYLQTNLRHPSLHTHEYDSLDNPYDQRQKAFEAYVQNQTPGAYRIFWCYGPKKGQITIIAITRHP